VGNEFTLGPMTHATLCWLLKEGDEVMKVRVWHFT
jgi:hypothetical protein